MIFSGETTDAFKYKSQRLCEVLQAVQIVYDGAGARSVLALCPSSTSSYIMHLMDTLYYHHVIQCRYINSNSCIEYSWFNMYTHSDVFIITIKNKINRAAIYLFMEFERKLLNQAIGTVQISQNVGCAMKFKYST